MDPVTDSPSEASPPAEPLEKRVALFAGAYNHIADGVSLTLNRLVRHLEEKGVAVRVFAPTVEDPQIEEHAGTMIPVPSLPAPGRTDYRIALGLTPRVRRALRRFDPTVVHIATPDLLGRHALSVATNAGVPVVASYHTHFSSYLKYYHLGWLEGAVWAYLRHFYARCDEIYVPSRAMADILRAHDISGRLRLWRRGVDTDRFAPERRSLEWRRGYGIDDDEVVVVFVSRLVREKGLDVYAEVIERLEETGVPHTSLVVGDGPVRDELETRLPNALFTGFLEGEALLRAYASSDVFLFPSDTETFGNVTLEAMASGLPTICARAAGSRDLVDEGTTGRLCPPGDVGAFADATHSLIRDAARRREMGKAARTRAQDFTWDAVLGRMNQYYEEVLARRTRSAGEARAL